MKEINLEEILDDCVFIDIDVRANVLSAMKEACRQTLELAAENAITTLHKSGKQIEVVTPILEPQYYEKGNGDLIPQGYAEVGIRSELKYENELVVVNKESILNTINQIV